MRVFLSWSGERSKLVAELLDAWLQCVLQALTPWMSSKDIDRGSLWFSEITDQLQNTMVGVICLTQDNKNKPWILFEAGALAKGLPSNRVCTFLIDLQPGDVANPLAQFNHTLPDRAGVWELVRTLNVALKERALKESILEEVFDTYWPKFDRRFQEILKLVPDAHEGEARPENEILQEILASTRSLEYRMRRMEHESIFPSTAISNEDLKADTASSIVMRMKYKDKIKNMLYTGMSEQAVFRILLNEDIHAEELAKIISLCKDEIKT